MRTRLDHFVSISDFAARLDREVPEFDGARKQLVNRIGLIALGLYGDHSQTQGPAITALRANLQALALPDGPLEHLFPTLTRPATQLLIGLDEAFTITFFAQKKPIFGLPLDAAELPAKRAVLLAVAANALDEFLEGRVTAQLRHEILAALLRCLGERGADKNARGLVLMVAQGRQALRDLDERLEHATFVTRGFGHRPVPLQGLRCGAYSEPIAKRKKRPKPKNT